MKNILEFETLAEFLEHFKDEKTCRDYFAAIRFCNGEYCPHCGHKKIYTFGSGKRYRCASCKEDFTIKTGTVFGESKVSLRKWFIAIYLLSTTSKGISSIQLAKHVGVTQKTGWFIDHRLRSAMKQGNGQLFGTIEMDETYIGGKDKNKHRSKRIGGTHGRSVKTKAPIVGLAQRGGEVRAQATDCVKQITVEKLAVQHAATGSKLNTDEFVSYARMGKLFPHSVINHSLGQYVSAGNIHTNTIESFWALFKRGYHGVYHHMSRKHLQKYVDECSFRWNRKGSQMASVFSDVVQRVASTEQLPYKELIA